MKCRVTSLLTVLMCMLLPACADAEKRDESRTVTKPQIEGLSEEDVIVKSASVSEATIKQWLRHNP